MRELRSIEVMSTAKIIAAISAIWGFISAVLGLIFIAPFAAVGSGLPAGTMVFNPLTLATIGISSLIVAPVIAAILGFVGGAVSALLYNFAAKYVGGIRLDL